MEVGFEIMKLKITGSAVYATSTTADIPIIMIKAIECKAGCLANIRDPTPTTIVNVEKKIAVLCEFIRAFPLLYLFNKPSSMKMLKSSPIPKMKVARMILTILNLIPNMAMRPVIITQLINMGRKLRTANSNLPYVSHRTKNIRNEDMNSTR